MARKPKPPPEKPSKAYLVSFGDTMTALLAFFIVLNSFSKEQTGANMYAGTGSFMNRATNSPLPGGEAGNRSKLVFQKKAPSPVYAVESEKKDSASNRGPDESPDDERIIDRQTESFKRFLSDINDTYQVDETPPTKSQIVFDSFENLNRPQPDQPFYPLKKNAIKLASEAIMKLREKDFELEVVVWSNMPGEKPLLKAMEKALAIQLQIDSIFNLNNEQRSRLRVTSKPWLFSDAIRPRLSFVISRMDLASSL